jgi:hypothetical protein
MERVQRELDEHADQLEMQVRINTAENLPLGPDEWQHDHAGKDELHTQLQSVMQSHHETDVCMTVACHVDASHMFMDMTLTGLDRILANLHAVALAVAVLVWLLRKVYQNALLPWFLVRYLMQATSVV